MKTTEPTAGSVNATMILGGVIGIALFAASAWAGNPGLGVGMLAIMLAYVAILGLGRRFDIVQMLRGEPADERYQLMMQRSMVFAANVLAIVTSAMFIYELAVGGDPGPYTLMGFIFALSMIGSLMWQRFTA